DRDRHFSELPLKLGERAQVREALGARAARQERWIVSAVFRNAGCGRRMRMDEGLCRCGREVLAREPKDGGKLVEQRARKACVIMVAMNGEPRLRMASAGEQWQQRAGRAIGN